MEDRFNASITLVSLSFDSSPNFSYTLRDIQRSSVCRIITFSIKFSFIEAIWIFSNLIKKIIQTLIRNMLNV